MKKPSDDSLWEYALERYARPGAEALCLTLQDEHGWDVCELVWLAWLAEHACLPQRLADPLPSPANTLGEIREWQREMTLALRQRRRALKPAALEKPSLVPLRQAIKQAELLAEHETLERLQTLPSRSAPVPALPAAAIALLGCHEIGEVDEDSRPLLEALFSHWALDNLGDKFGDGSGDRLDDTPGNGLPME